MRKESIATVAVKVKAYRQLLRLSQAFVGETVLEVDRTTYTRMENAKIEFSADDLRKLANLFRVSAGDFLTRNLVLSAGNKTQKGYGEFLPASRFRWKDEAAFVSLINGANDLVLFAGDKASRDYVFERQKKAHKTSARFLKMEDALRFCKSRRSVFLAGSSLLVEKFIIEEFGLWISWAPLGSYSTVYLEEGTAVTPGLKLPLPLVAVHSEHSLERQRLSMAHGLAHHLLGKKGKTGCPTQADRDPFEKEADYFARNLLMDSETLLKHFDSLRSSLKGSKGLLNAVLMTAHQFQVSYLGLVNQLAVLEIISKSEKKELLRFKTRDRRIARGKLVQPFEDIYVQYDEAHLGKKNVYQTDPDCGGPLGPQDLRYLQDSTYVEYLRFCTTKAPVELSVVFERVADYVRKKYPKYL